MLIPRLHCKSGWHTCTREFSPLDSVQRRETPCWETCVASYWWKSNNSQLRATFKHWAAWSQSPKKNHLCNKLNEFRSRFFLISASTLDYSLSETLIAALWHPKQRTHLSHGQTPDPWKFWHDVCFNLLNLRSFVTRQ